MYFSFQQQKLETLNEINFAQIQFWYTLIVTTCNDNCDLTSEISLSEVHLSIMSAIFTIMEHSMGVAGMYSPSGDKTYWKS